MELKGLKQKGHHRRDGLFKSRVVARLYMGLNDAKTLCKELQISRTLLRRWLRWDYHRRVLRWTKPAHQLIQMEKEQSMEALKKRLLELEKQLELAELKREGLEVLLDIGKEKYGLDLRKKHGAKQSKG